MVNPRPNRPFPGRPAARGQRAAERGFLPETAPDAGPHLGRSVQNGSTASEGESEREQGSKAIADGHPLERGDQATLLDRQ